MLFVVRRPGGSGQASAAAAAARALSVSSLVAAVHTGAGNIETGYIYDRIIFLDKYRQEAVQCPRRRRAHTAPQSRHVFVSSCGATQKGCIEEGEFGGYQDLYFNIALCA